MKRYACTLLLSAISAYAVCQPAMPAYTGKLTPSTNKEDLSKASFLSDITPGLWNRLVLPDRERISLNRLQAGNYQGYDIYPLGYNYLSPQSANYNRVIDYLSVNITSSHEGKTLSAESSNDQLSAAQKQVLAMADVNSDITIKVKFRYKDRRKSDSDPYDKVMEGTLAVTVVPATEAAFPGGFTELKDRLTNVVMNKLPSGGAAKQIYSDKIARSVLKFTVTEEGRVTDASVSNSSGDPYIDALLIDALYHLPQWKPAKNGKGQAVNQQFTFSLNAGGC